MVAAVSIFLTWSWVLLVPWHVCCHRLGGQVGCSRCDWLWCQWFYGAWSTVQARQSIAYQELFPVVIAAHLWGSLWARKHILFRSDNEAVVAILMTRTSKVPALMHLLHDLLLLAARWGFTFTAAHVPGVENKIADAIFRFCWQEFRQLAQEAHSSPCPIPQLLLDSLTPPP